MNADQELIDRVLRLTAAEDDPNRIALADWLDEHPEYQRTPVRSTSPPRGFTCWFRRAVVPRSFGEYLPFSAPSGNNRWNWEDALLLFANSPGNWFDHGGFSTVAGRSVLVGEPYRCEEEARRTAAMLHDQFGTPVAYSRRSRHGRAYRLIVWFDLHGRELSMPADRVVPLTDEYLRRRYVADPAGVLASRLTYAVYGQEMLWHGCSPLPWPRFKEALARRFPWSEVLRRGVIAGVRHAAPHEVQAA